MMEVSGDIDLQRMDRASVEKSARARSECGALLYLARSPLPGGFDAARRRSKSVRFLRWATGGLCVLATALIGKVALCQLFGSPPDAAPESQISIDGGRITLRSPKLSGFQGQGRSFQLKARAGFFDQATPTVAELVGIDALIGLNDASTLHVTAQHGAYDRLEDYLILDDLIQVQYSGGYSIFMKTAQIDFKTGFLTSREPVSAVLKGGHIAAKQMDMENGGRISFEGEVRSIIDVGESKKERSTGQMARK